jgi:hypothetical protein
MKTEICDESPYRNLDTEPWHGIQSVMIRDRGSLLFELDQFAIALLNFETVEALEQGLLSR